MPNVLSPNQLNMEGMNWIGEMNRKRATEIGGQPTSDDHPMILEMRRRIVGMVLEAAEVNFI